MADQTNESKEGQGESGTAVLIKIAMVIVIPAVIFAVIKYFLG